VATIPRLQRMEPTQALPQNDRINFKAQDQGANILNRTQAISSVAHAAGDLYQKYEDEKIDQIASKAEIDYTAWTDQELAKLKKH
jgi:hypothetical protein